MDEPSRKVVSHKVKTAAEIAAAIGDRPREKKVIMCHGTFDIVHPGHVRHLLYAKSKGDLLVASITADAHITKANLRPFVPRGVSGDQVLLWTWGVYNRFQDFSDLVVMLRTQLPPPAQSRWHLHRPSQTP